MILADKIINERKRNGWSQEEFADMLGVSRQAVSKWEGAQSTPDLQRIIQMAELFGVTTDYLLKDDMDLPEVVESSGREFNNDNAPRFVSMEDASAFLAEKEKSAPIIARSVVLCIMSPALLILLAGFIESGIVTEVVATGVGMVTLLIMVAIAVFSFITTGMALKDYEFLENDSIETGYGVTGMVRERKKNYAQTATTKIAIGVIFCILCPVPLIISALADAPEYVICAMVSLLLAIVSIGVYFIVRTGTITAAHDMLLQENDYSVKKKEFNRKVSPISSVYWCLVLAGYLAWSFTTNRWEFTWLVWPVAAVLFGAVSTIAAGMFNRK